MGHHNFDSAAYLDQQLAVETLVDHLAEDSEIELDLAEEQSKYQEFTREDLINMLKKRQKGLDAKA